MRQGPVRGCAGPCVRYFQYRVLCFLCQADSKTAVMAGGGGTVLLPPCRGAIFCVINKALPVADFYADVYDITNRFGGPIC